MKTILRNAAWLLCVAAFGFLSSCSENDASESVEKNYEQIAKFMRHNMYDANGGVTLDRLNDYQQGEWYISAVDETKACEYFTGMTGIAAQLWDNYEYEYKTVNNGRTVQIVLKGSRFAQNGIYATFYFTVPDFEEIKIIHFVDF